MRLSGARELRSSTTTFNYTTVVRDIAHLRKRREKEQEEKAAMLRERCINYRKDRTDNDDDDVFVRHDGPDGEFPTVEAMNQIQLDLERTFYTHAMFTERDGPGQRALFNVLAAYAKFNPSIGFVVWWF
jgi:hypothetical protein